MNYEKYKNEVILDLRSEFCDRFDKEYYEDYYNELLYNTLYFKNQNKKDIEYVSRTVRKYYRSFNIFNDTNKLMYECSNQLYVLSDTSKYRIFADLMNGWFRILQKLLGTKNRKWILTRKKLSSIIKNFENSSIITNDSVFDKLIMDSKQKNMPDKAKRILLVNLLIYLSVVYSIGNMTVVGSNLKNENPTAKFSNLDSWCDKLENNKYLAALGGIRNQNLTIEYIKKCFHQDYVDVKTDEGIIVKEEVKKVVDEFKNNPAEYFENISKLILKRGWRIVLSKNEINYDDECIQCFADKTFKEILKAILEANPEIKCTNA